MNPFDIDIVRQASGIIAVSARHNGSTVTREMRAPPLHTQNGLGWFDSGRRIFEELFGRPREPLRELWEEAAARALDHNDRVLVRFRSRREPKNPIQIWRLEAMIGTTAVRVPCRFYPFGRWPSPIETVRLFRGAGPGEVHNVPETRWTLGVLAVNSTHVVADRAAAILDFMSRLAPHIRCAPLLTYDGREPDDVVWSLRNEKVNLLVIVAHVEDENDLTSIQTARGKAPWGELLRRIGSVKFLNVVSASWCYSDHLAGETPATVLLDAGVPAVITWHPKPIEMTILPFHQGLLAGLTNGFDISTATSIGRAAIFNAINCEETLKWERAFAPRLYLREDAKVTALRFARPASVSV